MFTDAVFSDGWSGQVILPQTASNGTVSSVLMVASFIDIYIWHATATSCDVTVFFITASFVKLTF